MVVDTCIFIEHLRATNKRKTALYNFSDKVADLYISAVSLYELYMGATSATKVDDVKLITADLSVLPFTDVIAERASKIYHELRLANKMIEFRDIFIAATCLVNQLPLLTTNHKHFARIKGLKIV